MSARRGLTTVALATGPLLSWLLLRHWLPSDAVDVASAEAALVLLWCPLVFFSVPALVLQNSRDAALPTMTGPVASVGRAVLLLPYELAVGQRRVETWAALIGWLTIFALTWGSVAGVVGRLAGPLLP